MLARQNVQAGLSLEWPTLQERRSDDRLRTRFERPDRLLRTHSKERSQDALFYGLKRLRTAYPEVRHEELVEMVKTVLQVRKGEPRSVGKTPTVVRLSRMLTCED